MDVFLANEQSLPVDETRVTELARHTLATEEVGEDAELSVLLVGADHMRRLNARYASNDYATDVLAFPMSEPGEDEDDEDDDYLLGDVVICPEVAERNARRLGRTLEEEIDLLVVHGILHLLGYDHHTPRERAEMDARVRAVLSSFAGAAR